MVYLAQKDVQFFLLHKMIDWISTMAFDLQRARLETPGTAHVLHFNNAGSALPSQPVLDACQSVGQMPLNVETLGCDLLSATGRKYLRDPRGTGFLYVRNAIVDQLEPLTLSGFSAEWTGPSTYQIHAGANRFENFESNKAAVVGLGVAIDYAMQWGLDAIWQRVRTPIPFK